MREKAKIKFKHNFENFKENHPVSDTSIILEDIDNAFTTTGQGIGLFKDSQGRLRKAKYKITLDVTVEDALPFGILPM